MNSVVAETIDVLKDAFITFRSPTSRRIEREKHEAITRDAQNDADTTPGAHDVDTFIAQIRRDSEQANDGMAGADPESYDKLRLLELASLALSRHDESLKSRVHSEQRAYKMIAINLGINVFISGAIPEALGRMCIHGKVATLAVFLVMLYTGIKSALHCIHAIKPKPSKSIQPNFVEEAKSIFLSNPKKADALLARKIWHIEKSYEFNEKYRAVIAEHSWISSNATFVQFISAIVVVFQMVFTFVECPIC